MYCTLYIELIKIIGVCVVCTYTCQYATVRVCNLHPRFALAECTERHGIIQRHGRNAPSANSKQRDDACVVRAASRLVRTASLVTTHKPQASASFAPAPSPGQMITQSVIHAAVPLQQMQNAFSLGAGKTKSFHQFVPRESYQSSMIPEHGVSRQATNCSDPRGAVSCPRRHARDPALQLSGCPVTSRAGPAVPTAPNKLD